MPNIIRTDTRHLCVVFFKLLSGNKFLNHTHTHTYTNYLSYNLGASLEAEKVKKSPAMWENWV